MISYLLLLACTLASFIDGIKSTEEVLQLQTPGIAKTLQLPQGKQPNYDHKWLIESTPGTKISIKCHIALNNVCKTFGNKGSNKNLFTFNEGENEETFNGSQDFVILSIGNKVSVRVQLDEDGVGLLNCMIQSITGPNPNEYENVISVEVDSSENGITPGVRKTSCKCGWANKVTPRIFHGKEAKKNEFPWLIHLHILHEIGPFRYATSCGASILTPRHILTAAHCVVAQNMPIVAKPHNLIIVVGEHDTTIKNKDKKLLTGEKIFVRDLYLERGLEYDDIAIILTKETIEFNDMVGPICLEPKPYNLLHKSLTIMGWGMTEDGQPSTYLRKSKARVMDLSVCQMKPWDICTATVPSSLCVGDSGGPLVYLDSETNRYSQVALVSKVRPDCKGEASASTNVIYYYDWIQQIIKETEPTYSTCNKV